MAAFANKGKAGQLQGEIGTLCGLGCLEVDWHQLKGPLPLDVVLAEDSQGPMMHGQRGQLHIIACLVTSDQHMQAMCVGKTGMPAS